MEFADSDHVLMLSVRKLRELIRRARERFAPDLVARALRHHIMRMVIVEDEAKEIADLLAELVASAKERLYDAGIEPEQGGAQAEMKLPKRDREYVMNVGVLCTLLCAAEEVSQQYPQAVEHGREGLAWCAMAGDHLQASILWRALAHVYEGLNDFAGQEHSYRNALDAARLSNDAEQLVVSLHRLCSHFIVRQRLDEAEAMNAEERAVLRTELKGEKSRYYPHLLMNTARILMYRAQYSEGIRTLREALRWSDGDADPAGRAAILVHLGSAYLRLDQVQQSIECQHEVVQLGEAIGSSMLRGWGYFRLADAHMHISEWDQAEAMLERASEIATDRWLILTLSIMAKRSEILAGRGEFDEAATLCHKMVVVIGDHHIHDLLIWAYKMLAQIEEKRGNYQEAEEQYRQSIAIARREFPARLPPLEIGLAGVLLRLGREEDAMLLLDGVGKSGTLSPAERMKMLQLNAAAAEVRGDFRTALEHERAAMAVEREILERRAEQSLRNARIVAEIDLLEREADQERERRRRVERELAGAVVELGDRKRLVETVEQGLQKALESAGTHQEKAAAKTLRETLVQLRAKSRTPESPLRYLSDVDEDFYRRLRQRFPDLTSKQERLCGLLRAGLGSREISTLLGLESEGLKALRKRLRKRLGLTPEEKLETVLAAL